MNLILVSMARYNLSSSTYLNDIKLDGLSMIQKDIGQAMSFTKYHTRRAASSMIFLKLIARSIFEYDANKSIQFYHYYVQNLTVF